MIDLMAIQTSVVFCEFSRLFRGDIAAVIEAARVADACGIDQIGVPDHLAIGTQTDHYPYGPWAYPSDEPWPEPLTLLAAIASATSRTRLTTTVLIAPLRPALLLAKTAATLDVISGGRLDLGVGTGWQKEEFDAAGVPFVGRNARMDETLRACLALWRNDPASFHADSVSFDAMSSLPLPAQREGIPIWIGGGATPRNLSRIAEFGSGWLPVALGDTPKFAEDLGRVHSAMTAAGRHPSELHVKAGARPLFDAAGNLDVDATLGPVSELSGKGVTMATFGLMGFVRSPEEVRPFLERLGKISQRG
jgi:probable F420-dependent oxidoreductase